MPIIPEHLRFSTDHLWVSPESDTVVRIGITDFAQDSLGDVVVVTAPDPGTAVTTGEPCGEIESTKSISDLVAPVTGTVATNNGALADSPELLNTDPYGDGWIIQVDVDPPTLDQQLAGLLDAAAYRHLTSD
jgi:glycine cleavage system H protein